ncbi:MAG: zinc-ribbon domain-containing protein [Deltaproteobacteria bacterium]|jgi:predicted Zn finger-like uncharacterized protein|nr:zinc-ribbon domain-containing protein [Deltaproteobacteria bacterium]
MIITCKECSTSFNLDDSLVKESGSKCRCSVCKHIFTSYPLPVEKDQEPEEIPVPILESEPSDFKIEEEDFSLEEDNDLDIEPSDLEIDGEGIEFVSSDLEDDEAELELESSKFEVDDTDADKEDSDFDIDDDFSFEDSEFEVDTEDKDSDDSEFALVEGDAPVSEAEEGESVIKMEDEVNDDLDDASITEDDEFELEFDVKDDDFEFELDTEDEGSDVIEFDVEDDSDTEDIVAKEENFSFQAGSDEDDPVIPYEEKSIEDGEPEEPSIVIPEDDFAEYNEVLEQETEPEDYDSYEEETIEIDDSKKEDIKIPHQELEPMLTPAPGSRRRKKKSRIGTPVLLLLLIFLLVAGAYIASVMTGYKIPYISDIQIPFVEQYLEKPASKIVDAKPLPNQKSVNGRFVTNATTGTLFVITGRVENPSNIAYKHIQVSGALITKGKQEAKIKNAYCGNIIPEDTLKTGNIADINKIMAVKTGNNNLNADIKPKASIPFMVVFSDLPEKLQNFTVKVISFEKVKAN